MGICVDIDELGDPVSSLSRSLGSRPLPSSGGADGHPLQLIGPKINEVGEYLGRVGEHLGMGLAVPFIPADVDFKELTRAYRQAIYSATELFDVYAQKLPDRLGVKNPYVRAYKNASKKIRDPWALLCNKLKHNGSQIIGNMGRDWSGAITFGYFLSSPEGDRSMVKDAQVHSPKESRATFVRKIHELVHAILMVDHLAGELAIEILGVNQESSPQKVLSFPLGKVIRWLAVQPYFLNGEPTLHPGVLIGKSGQIELSKVRGSSLREPSQWMSTITADGYSSTYSFR